MHKRLLTFTSYLASIFYQYRRGLSPIMLYLFNSIITAIIKRPEMGLGDNLVQVALDSLHRIPGSLPLSHSSII